ncbi:ureidoglycolate lyase [Neorhizobium lilium]|uniref:Ureidoglycolate lyase n=1 Tax=Neorhizobium lilium TaxID=2503024 RepID=A0A444LI48_9HYPH|nr:ureidoglycolate lyase [Neorhizobium lilium]RWX78730.1 ureidoglycolate lyase [Neorhizobium lilium]
MSEYLPIHPLTKQAFLPYGDVIEADPSTMRLINGGTTERYHALAEPVVTGEPERLIFSIFRGKPRAFPYALTMMERHPHASQSFMPLSGRPFLVAVSDDVDGRPGQPKVFLVQAHQGVNYFPKTWHHPLMVLGEVSDFLVVDRDNTKQNLEEQTLERPYMIAEPTL